MTLTMRPHFWCIMSWTRPRDSPMPPKSRSALPKPSLQSEKVTAESDSPAEEAGFELLVPLQDLVPAYAGQMTRNPMWRISERPLFSERD